jgi:hypothetical protein
MTDNDDTKFNPAEVEPDPCPEDPSHTTEDAYGGPCRYCSEPQYGLGRVGPDLHPDWS